MANAVWGHRQIFASQIFIHRGKFLRDFSKSGKPPYDCTQSQMFEVYRLVQAFDPSLAAQFVDAAWVDAFITIPPLAGHVAALKRELPAYLSKCAGATFDHTDVAEFTKGVLLWWANNGKDFPTWALAMQIVGSFTPNSAAAERTPIATSVAIAVDRAVDRVSLFVNVRRVSPLSCARGSRSALVAFRWGTPLVTSLKKTI